MVLPGTTSPAARTRSKSVGTMGSMRPVSGAPVTRYPHCGMRLLLGRANGQCVTSFISEIQALSLPANSGFPVAK